MEAIYTALIAAAEQAREEYEKYKNDSYFSYVYANKRNILAEAAENLKASGDINAEFKKLKADYEDYSFRVKEEAVHPTFDWAGDHVWEMIYSGRTEGAKQAISILERYIF